MLNSIKKVAETFMQHNEFKIISHYDTDGITSAAIISRALQRADKKFTITIIKQLEKEFIDSLANHSAILFLDLASSHLQYFKNLPNKVFIIDHHEISGDIPENVKIINPHLFKEESLSSAELTYLFAKEIGAENKDLARLAVVGMVGDTLGEHLSKIQNQIISDGEVILKKGLLLYPATRPLNKTLEFSSSLFIPGVTGNYKGAISMLKDADIGRNGEQYKAIIDLTEDEMSRLVTAILLRRIGCDNSKLIGNLYLIKIFNHLEDARELSAVINACSRLGRPDISLSLCLENKNAKKKAEEIYAVYKQHIVAALGYVSNLTNSDKIEGKEFVIINAKENIKDTIIGTVSSILSSSSVYPPGTVIIAMAYAGEKIKVSARVAGREGRNVHEILAPISMQLGGECGGHPLAAGCLISKQDESQFIDLLKKKLEIELVKI